MAKRKPPRAAKRQPLLLCGQTWSVVYAKTDKELCSILATWTQEAWHVFDVWPASTGYRALLWKFMS
jgi:hypothetical protein